MYCSNKYKVQLFFDVATLSSMLVTLILYSLHFNLHGAGWMFQLVVPWRVRLLQCRLREDPAWIMPLGRYM